MGVENINRLLLHIKLLYLLLFLVISLSTFSFYVVYNEITKLHQVCRVGFQDYTNSSYWLKREVIRNIGTTMPDENEELFRVKRDLRAGREGSGSAPTNTDDSVWMSSYSRVSVSIIYDYNIRYDYDIIIK